MFFEKEISLVASSNPNSASVSADGSGFRVQFDQPLEIPANALNCRISIPEASIWNTSPNVKKDFNDVLTIYSNGNKNTIIIPEGLYDLDGLNSAIKREVENQSIVVFAVDEVIPILELSGDFNTQKTIIKFNYTGVYIDFTVPNSINELLGFNSRIVGPFSTVPHYEYTDNVANFNTINYFTIQSDLTNDGIRINNTYAGILAVIPITSKPGSQIVYAPFNPTIIPADNLIGGKRTNLRFQLLDDQLRQVKTTDIFSVRISIKYLVLVN